MNLKLRLIVMNILQYYVWGAWLISIGVYWFENRHWSGGSFGIIFSTMGIASLFMPSITGIIADKWINAEKLYGVLQILGAGMLFALPQVNDPTTFFWVMLVNMCLYMPTISLSITVAYAALKNDGKDVVRDYPPIRVWGTIGFIAAMWTINLLHLGASADQFYVASAASLLLGLYAFTLPPCPPKLNQDRVRTVSDSLGLTAFKLFKDPQMAIFFIFAMLLGAALQLTNAYGDAFLHSFDSMPQYAHLTAVKYPEIILSISQVSETLFILAIPFFLKRFGIKGVMVMSMFAWVLRFGLFGFGNPGSGLWMIILSCIVYGMAFDFFNISGSLYVESQAPPKIRASAQGLFMLMTNGIGAVLGSTISGFVIEQFFTRADGSKQWHDIWLSFAAYALVVAVLFIALFRKHRDPRVVQHLEASPEVP